MITNRELPADFIQLLASLEASYLREKDPIRQSGFSGGPQRWRAERGPILQAIETDGDLLDVGCANGYLLECLVAWASERGLTLTPHGLDQGAGLIALARERLPAYRDNFYQGNAWDWSPPRQFQYVYTLYDCVPQGYLEEYLHRLLQRVVAPGGRLIIGAYGSHSDQRPAFDIATFLEQAGLRVAGAATAGDLPVTRFAWIDQVRTQ